LRWISSVSTDFICAVIFLLFSYFFILLVSD
jgi:hypothetical protein